MAKNNTLRGEDYKVESGIKMPGGPGRGVRRQYPFLGMKVGDSFAVAKGDKTRVSQAALYTGRTSQMKFSIRLVGEDTYRCWRIS